MPNLKFVLFLFQLFISDHEAKDTAQNPAGDSPVKHHWNLVNQQQDQKQNSLTHFLGINGLSLNIKHWNHLENLQKLSSNTGKSLKENSGVLLNYRKENTCNDLHENDDSTICIKKKSRELFKGIEKAKLEYFKGRFRLHR